jgi:hypothetical protein
MKRWLISLFRSQAASTEPKAAPMDAVILNAHVTGVRSESLEEVMLLLQVIPREGRHFIIQHTEFVHPHDIHQLLQVGHRVQVTNTSWHPTRVQLVI